MLEGTALKGWLGSALALADQLPGKESVVCDLTRLCVFAPASHPTLVQQEMQGGVVDEQVPVGTIPLQMLW